MKASPIKLNATKCMKDVTVQVNLTNLNILKIRIAIGKFFIKCACWVMDSGVRFDSEVEK